MKLSPKHTIVTLALLSFCLVVIITLGKGLNLNPNSTGNALQDKPAKDFNIEIVQGSKTVDVSSRSSFTLDQFRGKPLVLNFWASWCVSCRTEAHELEKFWRKYQDQGVQVVGIAVHDSQETSKAFIAQYGKTYAIGLDLDGKAGINYGG